MLEYLVSGALFGLAGGFGPGPLMTLVITETLQNGSREGFKVAVAPLITDGPIMVVTLLLMDRLADAGMILGIVSLVGAVVVFRMGIDTARAAAPSLTAGEAPRHALVRGAIVNALNPHPYVFWIAVGAPTVLRARSDTGSLGAIAFVAGMYVCLVGGKMAVSVAVGQSRRFIRARVYRAMMITLGVLLCGFALLLLRDGLRLLGWIGGGGISDLP